MSQVIRKYLSGGGTPLTTKYDGLTFKYDDIVNTISSSDNISIYSKNKNLTPQQISALKDEINSGISLSNLSEGKSDLFKDYLHSLIASPATKIYNAEPKKALDSSEFYAKEIVNKLWGGNSKMSDTWFNQGDDATRAKKFAKVLRLLDIDSLYDKYDFSNSSFKSKELYAEAVKKLADDLDDGKISSTDYDKALSLGIDLNTLIIKNSSSSSSTNTNTGTGTDTGTGTGTGTGTSTSTGLTSELMLEAKRKEWLSTGESIYGKGSAEALQYVTLQEQLYNSNRLASVDNMKDLALLINLSKFATEIFDKSRTDNYSLLHSFSLLAPTLNLLLYTADQNKIKTGTGNYYVGDKKVDFATFRTLVYKNVRDDLFNGSVIKDDLFAWFRAIVGSTKVVLGKYSDFYIKAYNPDSNQIYLTSIFDESFKDDPIVKKAILDIYNKYKDSYGLDYTKFVTVFTEYNKALQTNPSLNFNTYFQLVLAASLQSLGTSANSGTQSAKKGGVLKFLQGGDINPALLQQWQLIDLQVAQQKADLLAKHEAELKQAGLTEELYQANLIKAKEDLAKQQKIAAHANLVMTNGLSDLTGTDITRIAAVAADVISLASSFVAGYGTVVSGATGLASWLLDTGADIADAVDGNMDAWTVFKNTATNFGLAAVGMIPGGSSGKIVSKILRWGPRILAILGAINTAPAVIGSVKKLVEAKGDFTKLTRLDWTNILKGMKMVTSGTKAARQVIQGNKYITENEDGTAIIKTDKGNTINLTGAQAKEYAAKTTALAKNDYLKSVGKLSEGELISLPKYSWVPGFKNKVDEQIIQGSKRYMTPQEVLDREGVIPSGYARLYLNMLFMNKLAAKETSWSKLFSWLGGRSVMTPEQFNSTYGTHIASKTATPGSGVVAVSDVASAVNPDTSGLAALQIAANDAAALAAAPQNISVAGNTIPLATTDASGQFVIPFIKNGKKLTRQEFIDEIISYKKGGGIIKLVTGGVTTKKLTDNKDNKSSQQAVQVDPNWWYTINGWNGINDSLTLTNSLGKNSTLDAQSLNYSSGYDDNNNTTMPFSMKDAKAELLKYYATNKIFSDVKNAYLAYLKSGQKQTSVEGFVNWYNSKIDEIRNSQLYKGRPKANYGDKGYSSMNKIFNTLYSSYTTGYDSKQDDILGGATYRRVVNTFKDLNDLKSLRSGNIIDNDNKSFVWMDNSGKLHYGSKYGEGVNEAKSEEKTSSTGDSVLDSIMTNLQKEDPLNLQYDFSLIGEGIKKGITDRTNKKAYLNLLETPVALESPYSEQAEIYDYASTEKLYDELIAKIRSEYKRYADSQGDPEKAAIIMNTCEEKVQLLLSLKNLALTKVNQTNLKEAVDTINNNTKYAWTSSENNNKTIATKGAAVKSAESSLENALSQSTIAFINDILDRYDKARTLQNTNNAQSYKASLQSKFTYANQQLQELWNKRYETAYSEWKTKNPDKGQADFATEWNNGEGKIWQQRANYLSDLMNQQYYAAIAKSTDNPLATAFGVSYGAPDVSGQKAQIPYAKKGASLTYEEQKDLLYDQNLAKSTELTSKNNLRREIEDRRLFSRAQRMVSAEVAKLINKALGL